MCVCVHVCVHVCEHVYMCVAATIESKKQDPVYWAVGYLVLVGK